MQSIGVSCFHASGVHTRSNYTDAGSFQVPGKDVRELENRIRKQLTKIELSTSAYDTAWVAMVPAPGSSHSPCFPQCLQWILRNQHADGSWGLLPHNLFLKKDALSSTVACVLALKRWAVGDEHVEKAIKYIKANIDNVFDENLVAPIGFGVIFAGMIRMATDMGLLLPLTDSDISEIFRLRDVELNRNTNCPEGQNAYMAYVAEGLGKLQDWNEVMNYQKNNGSLFNSPSTTAAAFIHLSDIRALDYLNQLVQKFDSSVPTLYPLDVYTQLCVVDTLEKMGISPLYKTEVKNILDEVYSCWLRGDEEITSDMRTSAMAFRILRLNGYGVSTDSQSLFSEATGRMKDTLTLIELQKASQVKFENEPILDNISAWSGQLLKDELHGSKHIHLLPSYMEVNYALKYPFHGQLDRLEHKRNIENFSASNFQMLKTAYRPCILDDDLLTLAVERYAASQYIYRTEYQYLESWIAENRLDQLKFARQKLAICYFSAAATLFSPEFSDARISWVKNSVLTTVVDDFFDVGGSKDEIESLIKLVENWNNNQKELCTENVEIIFSALRGTIEDLGAKACKVQNRSVTEHMIKIWLGLLKSMMNEAVWQRDQHVPTMDQYMSNGVTSFALGPIILPALYFAGPVISEDVINDAEYSDLFTLVSTCGRLLNDIRGFEREGSEGKLNSVSLLLYSRRSTCVEDAKRELERSIDTSRRHLLQMVLKEGTKVPRECKEIFWKMCKVIHFVYRSTDAFSSPKELLNAVNSVLHNPLQCQPANWTHQNMEGK